MQKLQRAVDIKSNIRIFLGQRNVRHWPRALQK